MKSIQYIFFITVFMTFHHTIIAVNDTTQSSLQEKIEQLQKQKDELEIQLNENLTDEQQQNILQQIIILEDEIHTQKLLLNEQAKKITSPFWKKAAIVLIGVIFTIITGKILWNQNAAKSTQPATPTPPQTQPQKKIIWKFTDSQGNKQTLSQKPDFDTAPLGKYTATIIYPDGNYSSSTKYLKQDNREIIKKLFDSQLYTTQPSQPTTPVAQPQKKSKWTYTYRGQTVELTEKPDFDTCPPGKYTAVREVDPFNPTTRGMKPKETREINEYDAESRDWAKRYFKDFL